MYRYGRKIHNNQTQKKKVRTDCPNMVKQYNAAMGGVDLADMLIELYRTKIVTRKLWYLKLIFHCDIFSILRKSIPGCCTGGIVIKRKPQQSLVCLYGNLQP